MQTNEMEPIEREESNIEMTDKEKMERMQQQIDGLNAAMARANEFFEQLQRIGVLNKDPENLEGTFTRINKS